jgi:prepilin peptidase CpaA
MIPEVLILVLVPTLLALAAGWDLASYTIPNSLSLVLVLAFALFAVAAHMPPERAAMHALAGALGLAAGFALFAGRFIGGGDAKLFAAVTLWIGFSDLLEYALAVSLFGGALALLLMSLRRVPLPTQFTERAWIARLYNPTSGIPYGVALAAGALAVLQHTEVFKLAFR